ELTAKESPKPKRSRKNDLATGARTDCRARGSTTDANGVQRLAVPVRVEPIEALNARSSARPRGREFRRALATAPATTGARSPNRGRRRRPKRRARRAWQPPAFPGRETPGSQ